MTEPSEPLAAPFVAGARQGRRWVLVAVGLVFILIIRLRDLVFGGIGLGLGLNYLTCMVKKSKLNGN